MAPETLKLGKPASLSDIWSLGCCLIEMLTSKAPWKSTDLEGPELIGHILDAKSTMNSNS
jgi:serine/threonine protein kinase